MGFYVLSCPTLNHRLWHHTPRAQVPRPELGSELHSCGQKNPLLSRRWGPSNEWNLGPIHPLPRSRATQPNGSPTAHLEILFLQADAWCPEVSQETMAVYFPKEQPQVIGCISLNLIYYPECFKKKWSGKCQEMPLWAPVVSSKYILEMNALDLLMPRVWKKPVGQGSGQVCVWLRTARSKDSLGVLLMRLQLYTLFLCDQPEQVWAFLSEGALLSLVTDDIASQGQGDYEVIEVSITPVGTLRDPKCQSAVCLPSFVPKRRRNSFPSSQGSYCWETIKNIDEICMFFAIFWKQTLAKADCSGLILSSVVLHVTCNPQNFCPTNIPLLLLFP